MGRNDYENYFNPEQLNLLRNHALDDPVIEMAKPFNKILDVGAGCGHIALKLKLLGKDITCIDIKKDYVNCMKAAGLNAIEGDIRKLPFKDKEFELVICSEVLEHLENPGEGLKELCRVANNVIFTVPKNFPEEWHLWNIDYIPYVSRIKCLIVKMSMAE